MVSTTNPQAQIVTLNFVILDVFTTTPYEGNPLAVVHIPYTLHSMVSQEKKQKIAKEFNLSETVFLHERREGVRGEWQVDIFTTTEEIPFAGHPTVGAGYVVLESLEGQEREEAVVLRTKAGDVGVKRVNGVGEPHGSQLWVSANVPHNVRVHRRTFGNSGIEVPWPAMSENIRDAERKAAFVSIVKGMTFMLIQLESLEELERVGVRNEDLGFNALLDEDEAWNESFVARYYYVLLDEGGKAGKRRVRARMLELGMEDPATGSAACALCSYLALEGEGEKFEVVQGVEMGRRSVIGVEVGLEERGKRFKFVSLSGSAAKIMNGTLKI